MRYMLGRRSEVDGTCARSSVGYDTLDEGKADVEDQFDVPAGSWRGTEDGGAISDPVDGHTYVLIPAT
jgi:hypothetical protein